MNFLVLIDFDSVRDIVLTLDCFTDNLDSLTDTTVLASYFCKCTGERESSGIDLGYLSSTNLGLSSSENSTLWKKF